MEQQHSPVILKEHTSEWAIAFEMEQERLVEILGENLIQLEHVGSTAIPGIPAKPILDIAAQVHSLDLSRNGVEQKLAEFGYEYVPKEGFPDRRFFRRGPWGNGTHHLHVYEKGARGWDDLLRFRDYLRKHQEAAGEYTVIKRRLASIAGSRQEYTDGKTEFVRSILQKSGQGR
jgi:GrpB-like predicted nucleotidyltransferase (UPF0157 family)